MNRRYTKSDLEQLVNRQLENLNAMHDLLSIMKLQNDLIKNINKTLREEILQFKTKRVTYATNRKKRA